MPKRADDASDQDLVLGALLANPRHQSGPDGIRRELDLPGQSASDLQVIE
jgi:hypothetical protein